MMDATVRARVDSDLKQEAEAIFKTLDSAYKSYKDDWL